MQRSAQYAAQPIEYPSLLRADRALLFVLSPPLGRSPLRPGLSALRISPVCHRGRPPAALRARDVMRNARACREQLARMRGCGRRCDADVYSNRSGRAPAQVDVQIVVFSCVQYNGLPPPRAPNAFAPFSLRAGGRADRRPLQRVARRTRHDETAPTALLKVGHPHTPRAHARVGCGRSTRARVQRATAPLRRPRHCRAHAARSQCARVPLPSLCDVMLVLQAAHGNDCVARAVN